MCRRGFTLVEMLVAAGISAAIAAGVLTAFVGLRDMTGAALSEAELSVRMRELREKLLFRAAPTSGGRVWAGMLSPTNLYYEVSSSQVGQQPPGDASSWMLEDTLLEYDAVDPVNGVGYVKLTASVLNRISGERVVTRRERVAVPVFGTVQRTLPGEVFDD